jgi:hypothetical protein
MAVVSKHKQQDKHPNSARNQPQGELCARRPLPVIGAGVLLVALCLLGLLRFRLETDPLKLWVGPGSQVGT